jgi:hypothetical protein
MGAGVGRGPHIAGGAVPVRQRRDLGVDEPCELGVDRSADELLELWSALLERGSDPLVGRSS